MNEFRFLHLERRRIDQALPAILEEAVRDGWSVVVQAASEERVDALNERLWTYADDSFLPHGSARDGEPHAQPVYLTAGDDNPNGAVLRVLSPAFPPQLSSRRATSVLRCCSTDATRRRSPRRVGNGASSRPPAQPRPIGGECEDGGWEKGT